MFSLPAACLHISISFSRRKETASIPHDDPHDFSQVMNRSEISEKPRGPHCTAADLERRRGDYDNYGSPFIIKFWPGISGQASERARERMMRPPERKAGRRRENVADSIQPALMQWGATTQHNGNKC